MTSDGTDRIKTAFERAMERIKDLEAPTKENRLEWKGVPAGSKLAADYLKGEGDLAAAVQKTEAELRPYVLKGILDVLTTNVQLPKTEVVQKATDRALEGIRIALRGKPQVKEIIGRAQYVCEQYKNFGNQQRQQVYDQLKQQFTAQVQQAIRRKGVAGDANINVETTPEFQQEWRRVRIHLDEQYEQHLENFRKEVKAVA